MERLQKTTKALTHDGSFLYRLALWSFLLWFGFRFYEHVNGLFKAQGKFKGSDPFVLFPGESGIGKVQGIRPLYYSRRERPLTVSTLDSISSHLRLIRLAAKEHRIINYCWGQTSTACRKGRDYVRSERSLNSGPIRFDLHHLRVKIFYGSITTSKKACPCSYRICIEPPKFNASGLELPHNTQPLRGEAPVKNDRLVTLAKSPHERLYFPSYETSIPSVYQSMRCKLTIPFDIEMKVGMRIFKPGSKGRFA